MMQISPEIQLFIREHSSDDVRTLALQAKKYPDINTAVSDFIIHLHTVWMFTLFEELLMHAVPKQEMESILHDYILFEIQGWRALLRV